MKKIYLIYAKIPDPLYQMLSFYIRYIEKTFTISVDNKWLGLYAWTTSKKKLKIFKETRKKAKVYIYKEKMIEKDYLKKFSEENKDSKLGNYEYIQSYSLACLPPINVITTLEEYNIATDNDIIYEFLVENSVFQNYNVDYMIFRTDIINALDILNYTTEYDLFWGGESEDDGEDRTETANYLMSYNQTPFGNKYIGIYDNEFASLMMVFSSLFLGDE